MMTAPGALIAATLLLPVQTFTPDGDGFIRNWLVLAPIAVEEDSGASEIQKDFLGGEASVMPKADDKVNVGGKILSWTPHQTSDYFIDFLGSSDQCKVWVNGAPIVTFTDTRTLDKDTDSGDVTLRKGQNVLVFKVINEKNNWQGAARFLKDGAPVKNLMIALAPR